MLITVVANLPCVPFNSSQFFFRKKAKLEEFLAIWLEELFQRLEDYDSFEMGPESRWALARLTRRVDEATEALGSVLEVMLFNWVRRFSDLFVATLQYNLDVPLQPREDLNGLDHDVEQALVMILYNLRVHWCRQMRPLNELNLNPSRAAPRIHPLGYEHYSKSWPPRAYSEHSTENCWEYGRKVTSTLVVFIVDAVLCIYEPLLVAELYFYFAYIVLVLFVIIVFFAHVQLLVVYLFFEPFALWWGDFVVGCTAGHCGGQLDAGAQRGGIWRLGAYFVHVHFDHEHFDHYHLREADLVEVLHRLLARARLLLRYQQHLCLAVEEALGWLHVPPSAVPLNAATMDAQIWQTVSSVVSSTEGGVSGELQASARNASAPVVLLQEGWPSSTAALQAAVPGMPLRVIAGLRRRAWQINAANVVGANSSSVENVTGPQGNPTMQSAEPGM
ncbi:unnamed protein product, partial [Symbiodinium sp. KB8]